MNTLINKRNSAIFDSRAFILPEEEVCNYFIWRQQDATRNSIQMVAQCCFSHKELQNKSCNDIQDMLFTQKSTNWNDFETVYKRGSCCVKKKEIDTEKNIERSKWAVDTEIPIFTQDRDYIEKYLIIER